MPQSIRALSQLMPCPGPGQELSPLARDGLSGSGCGCQVGSGAVTWAGRRAGPQGAEQEPVPPCFAVGEYLFAFPLF